MISQLTNKEAIQEHLEQNLYLNIYALGDLDEFFWPRTTWYGLQTGGRVHATVLIYAGPDLPTVVALSSGSDGMEELLSGVIGALPNAFFAHLSPGLGSVLESIFVLQPGLDHYKMALEETAGVLERDTSSAQPLDASCLTELEELYTISYPGNWFDPRMLETGKYVGIRDNRLLVSVAGVHVYSRRYRVAALGNIVTRPTHRNAGYGTTVTAAVCKSLLAEDIRIGLNVQADNGAAISSYERLGFRKVAPYLEYEVRRR